MKDQTKQLLRAFLEIEEGVVQEMEARIAANDPNWDNWDYEFPKIQKLFGEAMPGWMVLSYRTGGFKVTDGTAGTDPEYGMDDRILCFRNMDRFDTIWVHEEAQDDPFFMDMAFHHSLEGLNASEIWNG